jgi:hypothetical protein
MGMADGAAQALEQGKSGIATEASNVRFSAGPDIVTDRES